MLVYKFSWSTNNTVKIEPVATIDSPALAAQLAHEHNAKEDQSNAKHALVDTVAQPHHILAGLFAFVDAALVAGHQPGSVIKAELNLTPVPATGTQVSDVIEPPSA